MSSWEMEYVLTWLTLILCFTMMSGLIALIHEVVSSLLRRRKERTLND